VIVKSLDIAVVGMSCRFPGAASPDAFWEDLRAGRERVTRLTDEELLASGVPHDLLRQPNYVKAGAFVDNLEMFDPVFFGFSPRDASIMDPQHRLLLECAWEALEHAGHDSQRFQGAIGVFAGCGMNTYLIRNILSNPTLVDELGFWLVRHLGNDKDFLTTRVSYCLDLKGPSVNIQTACSTSLVAIHAACQSLLNGECDMALAGGVTIENFAREGYLYEEGEILSPDGHCRAFARGSAGTVLGNGVGVVALRRLDDAVASGDTIHAVVKGSAVNNDGAGKVGFFAPSVDGHTKVVLEALGVAGIDADTITYVEAHGTGTSLGDPIEIQALTAAFRRGTIRAGFCGIGSVKTNIGHLDTAAGVASFIKVVEALKHRQLPPSLHFDEPNPLIDFQASPFFVVDALQEWESSRTPRRAGVSSLGVGGTNAHVILEEAPDVDSGSESRRVHVLPLSAKTTGALESMTRNLAAHLRAYPEVNLADVAHTLQVGRRGFDHRRIAVCSNIDDAVRALDERSGNRLFSGTTLEGTGGVAFMFPGQGSQRPGMAATLYAGEAVFRTELDRCSRILRSHIGIDLLEILYPREGSTEAAAERLRQTAIAQPALLAVEYSLARLWMSWGLRPHALIGHSIGEYTAACVSEALSLEEALLLVALRGRLMQQLPRGLMTAVPLAVRDVRQLLTGIRGVSIAAQNGPTQTVVSGEPRAIEELEGRLAADFVPYQRLHTSHAFHSAMMDPILDQFTTAVAKAEFRSPTIPWVSNVSGTWMTEAEMKDPAYWARHLRSTVLFGDGLTTLLARGQVAILEVGPGKALSTLARQQLKKGGDQVVLRSLGGSDTEQDDEVMLRALAQMWVQGVGIDWAAFNAGQRRRRIPLPTYPFERQRCWVAPGASYRERRTEVAIVANTRASTPRTAAAASTGRDRDNREPVPAAARAHADHWFWRPVWKRADVAAAANVPPGRWIVFADESGFAARFRDWLESNAKPTKSTSIGIAVREPGSLDGLSLVATDRRPPASHEVEIEVHAAGLNFRDVLTALGVYPDGLSLGSECVGTVTAVGSDVKGLQPGDPVLAIAQDSFRMHVTVDANFVVRKPKRLSLEEAATIPVVFMTAAYALHHVARLAKGERVLIHAAAGGVGFAAVQLALAAGAEVFATAGSHEKREFLRSRGVEHVFDSRSLGFADEIMTATAGTGVDVVLNSLAGEFIPKSLSVLRPFGRFLEIGKADIYQGSQLGLEPFKKMLSFHAIDLELVARDKPAVYRQLFEDLVRRFDEGTLTPLPYRLFPHTRARDAFDFMAGAKHIGKVVLTFTADGPSVVLVRPGDRYDRIADRDLTIAPARREDYTRLLDDVGDTSSPLRIVHFWNVGDTPALGFYPLLHLAQAVASTDSTTATRMLVVSTGMQQVLPGEAIAPEKAVALGPVKVVPREIPTIHCRSVDLTRDVLDDRSSDATFMQLVTELEHEGAGESVAYRGGSRYAQTFEAIQPKSDAKPTLRDGGVYLITGGLGGVGLTLAEHLARQWHAKLVLIGRTALPPRSTWQELSEVPEGGLLRRLMKIESIGGGVMVAAADVTDAAAMMAVVDAATSRFGTIHGVIHAAGVVNDGAVELKDPSTAARVLAPKVTGTAVLERVLKDVALDFLVLFSSTSAVMGVPGQVDYTAANAFLNAFARNRHTAGRRTIAFEWGPWLDVGMAARMVEQVKPRVDQRIRQIEHPFLDVYEEESAGEVVFGADYQLGRRWLVDEHQMEGVGALIPGTGYLELARASFAEHRHSNGRGVEIRDVSFLSPFRVSAERSRRLSARLSENGSGVFFQVTSQDPDGRVIDHAEGTIVEGHSGLRERESLQGLQSRCSNTSSRPLVSAQFRFGPRWRCLKSIGFGGAEALATIELDEAFSADLERIKLHPAMLDVATSCAFTLIDGFDPRTEVYVPVTCELVRLHQALPRRFYSHLRLRQTLPAQGLATFDVRLIGPDGDDLAEIDGFTFRKVTQESLFRAGQHDRTPGTARLDHAGSSATTAPAPAGIAPARGVEAFETALDSFPNEPEVIISPDFERLLKQATLLEIPPVEPVVGVSTNEASSPAAGEDDVDRVVGRIWSTVLGVERLGPDDDFFDMGADSLSALRALAQIKRALKATLTVAMIYEHPNLAQLTRAIRERRAAGG
jgi:acyl transferase domain-containing protein/aryl carrier-like protein